MKITKQKVEKLALIIIIIFAVLGSAVSSIAIHEYSHAQDYQGLTKNEEVCALVLPETPSDLLNAKQPAGYFSFDYNPEDIKEINRIDKYTEKKAYSLSALPIALLAISVLALIIAKTEF